MNIGLIDLDTSHPAAWVPLIRARGHEIAAVFDHGEVHPPGYARRFAHDHGIAAVSGSVEELIAASDAVVIHSCNWDRHRGLAQRAIDAGRAVLIDKPFAGRIADLDQLVHWSANGARIAGGSALRYCDEARALLAEPVEERGVIDTAVCGCGVDEFNYGVHAYAMLAAMLGTDAQAVRHLSRGRQRRIEIAFTEGRSGIVIIGATPRWLPFYFTAVTDRGVRSSTVDPAGLYASLLDSTLPYLAGEAPALLSAQAMTQPERWAIAAQLSWTNGDRWVSLDELDGQSPGYDGAAFAESYRRAKYPEA